MNPKEGIHGNTGDTTLNTCNIILENLELSLKKYSWCGVNKLIPENDDHKISASVYSHVCFTTQNIFM
jgi:hypothetical protein